MREIHQGSKGRDIPVNLHAIGRGICSVSHICLSPCPVLARLCLDYGIVRSNRGPFPMILSRILSRIVGEKMIWMIICRFPRAITKKTEPSIMRATPRLALLLLFSQPLSIRLAAYWTLTHSYLSQTSIFRRLGHVEDRVVIVKMPPRFPLSTPVAYGFPLDQTGKEGT